MPEQRKKKDDSGNINTEKDLQNLFQQIRKANMERIPDDSHFRQMIIDAIRREKETRKKRSGLIGYLRNIFPEIPEFSPGTYAAGLASFVIISVAIPVYFLSREKSIMDNLFYHPETELRYESNEGIIEAPAPSRSAEKMDASIPSMEFEVQKKKTTSLPAESPRLKREAKPTIAPLPSPLEDRKLSRSQEGNTTSISEEVVPQDSDHLPENYKSSAVERLEFSEGKAVPEEEQITDSNGSRERELLDQLSKTQDKQKQLEILEKLIVHYRTTGQIKKMEITIKKKENLESGLN